MGRPSPAHSAQLDLDPEAADHVLLEKVVSFYEHTFETEPEGQDFLTKNGLTNPELRRAFKVGLSNRTLGLVLPKKFIKKGRQLRARLENLGVFRADSGHEHLRGAIVVPLFDKDGRVVQLYGRLIGHGLRPGVTRDVWLPGPKIGLVNRAAFETKDVVVAASVLDALVLWNVGVTNVTAAPGLDGPFDDLVAAVEEHGVTKVTFAFPRSKESDDATHKIRTGIAIQGVVFFRAELPRNTSAFDFAKTLPDPASTITALVRAAEWIGGTAVAKKPIKESVTQESASVMESGPQEPKRREPVATDAKDSEHIFTFEDRRWRIRGLQENRARGTMKVNIVVSREAVGFHVDTFDLYSSRHRTAFLRLAGDELGVEEAVLKKDMGHVLLALEQAQEELLRRVEKPEPKPVSMTLKERDEALALLRDPELLNRILADFEKLGVVGEKDNLLVGLLVSVSRKLDRPLAAIVQSSPAAGKSSVMEAVLKFVPPEDRHAFSAMTGQALFYMGGKSLQHRVISIAEEQGASRAAYSLKLLQSEGSLTIASTGKDHVTGQLVSHEYKVEGPVALMMTTTAIDVDEELLSRCLVLSVDEGPEQTRKIQERQRWATTLEGRLRVRDEAQLVKLHQNAQRLLRPVVVVNPFALDMVFSDLRVRARRDHPKLLGLIEAIALVHQHQREVKTVDREDGVVEFIEVERTDIETAQRLLAAVGAVDDADLPPQTGKLLEGLLALRSQAQDRAAHRFTRRQVREQLGLGSTQAKVHLKRLVEAEYVIVHRSPHGRGVVYQLAYDDERSAIEDERSGGGRPKVEPRSGGGRPPENDTNGLETSSSGSIRADIAKNARQGGQSRERPTADPNGAP